MKVNKFLILLLACVTLFCAGCDRETQAEKEDKAILSYLETHQIQATKHESGLYYRIDDPGSGAVAVSGTALITAHYKGQFLDGEVFDESDAGNPLVIRLNQLIAAWQITMPLIKKGGKLWLITPSDLGYGEFGSGSIPGNSVLIFEIELLDYKNN